MKHKLIKLITVIIIVAFAIQSLARLNDVVGQAWGQARLTESVGQAKGEGVSTGVDNGPTPLSPGQNLRPLAAGERHRGVGGEQMAEEAHIISRRELPEIQGVVFDALELERHPERILAPVIRRMELRYDSLIGGLSGTSVRLMEGRKIIGVVQFPTAHLVRIALAPALAKKQGRVYQVGHFYLAERAGFGDKGYGYSSFGLDISTRTARINSDRNVPEEGHVVYLDSMHNQIVHIARILSSTLCALHDAETGQTRFNEQDAHDFAIIAAESDIAQVLEQNLSPDIWIMLNRPGQLLLGDVAALSLFPEEEETAGMIVNRDELCKAVATYLDQAYQLVQKHGMERILTRLTFIESQVIMGDFEELQYNLSRLLKDVEKMLKRPDNTIEQLRDLQAAKQIVLQVRRMIVNFDLNRYDAGIQKLPDSKSQKTQGLIDVSVLRPKAFREWPSRAAGEDARDSEGRPLAAGEGKPLLKFTVPEETEKAALVSI